MATTSPRNRSGSIGNTSDSINTKLYTCVGHTETVKALCHNATTLISGSDDNTVRFWDIKDGTEGMKIGPFEGPVLWVGIMPNAGVEESKYLYIALDNRVVRYDTLAEAEVKSIRLPSGNSEIFFRSAVFNPPNQLFVGLNDGCIIAFDVWSGTAVSRSSKGHSSAVSGMAIDFTSGTLFSISDDKTLKMWKIHDLTTPIRTTTFGLTSFNLASPLPYSLAIGGEYLFVGVKQKAVFMGSIANLLSGGTEIVARFPHPTSVTTLSVIEGTLVSVSGDVVFLWSIADRTQIGTIESKDCFISALEVTNARIFCGGNDNCVHAFRFMPQATMKTREAARKKDTDLSLTYCQLTDLPTMIKFSAKFLTNLNLSHNSFTALPTSISTLQSLTSLHLSHNQLDTLPWELQNLAGLTTLGLDNNRFKMIPLAVAGLLNLRNLNLSHNNITFLFPFLTQIPIVTLDVAFNPLEDPPVDVAKGGLSAILDYLHAKASLQPVNVDRVKVMLVGNENVGKTSLVVNLRHKASLFSARPNIKTLSTQGISIETVQSRPASNLLQAKDSKNDSPSPSSVSSSVSSPTSSRGEHSRLVMSATSGLSKDKKKDAKRKVKWYTWDFGGQEIYYHTHQFFITPHSIYVIAFDVTKPLDENNIYFWLRCIKARTSTSRGTHSYSGDSQNKAPVPVILVGTHIDSFEKASLPWLHDMFLVNSKEDIALKTKKDDAFLEVYFSWIYRKFSSEHPSIKLVTGVSSKSGKGIKELKQALRNLIDSDVSIRTQVNSVVYDRVFHFDALVQRAKLAAMPPFLSWMEYQTMAEGCIDDQTHLLEATKLLANLGSLVYLPSSSRKNSWMVSMAQLFPEDYETPPSAEFVVLDPQWLVDLFATILGTSPNFVRNGMIRSQDLQQIWKDHAKFPPNMHRQLMLILEHFDVAFALGSQRKQIVESNPVVSGLPAPKLKQIAQRGQSTLKQNLAHSTNRFPSDDPHFGTDETPTHLFPSLLPTSKPQLDILWPPYEHRFQVDRIYTFPRFLPLGLFSRFMVRLLSYFPAFYYWRHGVIISDDTKRAYALIEEMPSDNRVSITVRGPVNAVSQFLTSVMDIWTKLVADMYDINVTMTTTCYHCTAQRIENPHIFELSVCEALVVSGERFTMCSNGGVIRLDQLCPDLCLVNIRALEIDPSMLKPWGRDPADGGVIGEGGFGIVYRKSYKGQKVAVKRFKEIQKTDLQPEELAKIHTAFRNEIWLMSGVSHPNIVKLVGFSLRVESIMVMEYISGGDLYEALISKRQFTWPLRYRIALDIARGMAALHGLNPPLCHSDLKCPNCMMVDWDPQADIVSKVSDFGLSSRLYGDQLTKTPTTNPFWTAPEVLAQLPFDTSADVYSFGVILWNLLSRKALFEEMLPWTDDVSRAVRAGKRPPIPKERGMPPEYESLIKRCWDHTPTKRPRFVEICIELEKMIREHCPELVAVVERTRAEMTSAVDHNDVIRSNAFYSTTPGQMPPHLGHISGPMGHTLRADPSFFNSSATGSTMFTANDLIRTSVVTNTWGTTLFQAADSSASSTASSASSHAPPPRQEYVIPPTYYNNSKLADYGTTLLKQMHLGSVVTLMVPVGLSQVWAFSPSLGLVYVINSVSGQFVKSFVAPKDLTCLIEVDVREGSSEVWGAGLSGLHIWHSETAQAISHSPSTTPISSLLFIYKPNRRSMVWAGVANAPKIQIWSALSHDLCRVQDLKLPDSAHPIAAPIPLHQTIAIASDEVKTINPTTISPRTTSKASSLSSSPNTHATSTLGTTPPTGYHGSAHSSPNSSIPNTPAQPHSASSHIHNTSTHLHNANHTRSRSSSKSHVAITPDPASQLSHLDISHTHLSSSQHLPLPSSSNSRDNSKSHKRSASLSGALRCGVQSMIRTPDAVWVSAGAYLLRLNKNNAEVFETPEHSPDEHRLITNSAATEHGTGQASSGTHQITLAHAGGTHTMVYAGLQRVWTCGADGSLKIWDSSDATLLMTIFGYFPRQLLVVDRTQIWATQSTGTAVDIWNLDTCELVSRMETAHTQPLNRAMLVFNKTVWTAGQDEAIHVFT